MGVQTARESDKRVQYVSRPGTQEGGCYARIWVPPKQVSSDLKVAILLHGGAFVFGEDSDVPKGEVDYLNSKGIVVVSLQYRLAPHANFKDITEDLIAGYRWVWSDLPRHVGGAEKVSRVTVSGWSAGATATTLLALQITSTGLASPCAVMVTYGIFDFNLPYTTVGWPEGVSKEDTIKEDQRVLGEALKDDYRTGLPHQPPANTNMTPRQAWCARLFRQSRLLPYLLNLDPRHSIPSGQNPIELVTPEFPPTFVMVATKDTSIDPAQSYTFIEKLKKEGVEVQYGEADMEHGRSEVDWAGTEETQMDYQRWFETAIRPGLDFLIAKLSA